jgi:hypothetical protein
VEGDRADEPLLQVLELSPKVFVLLAKGRHIKEGSSFWKSTQGARRQ